MEVEDAMFQDEVAGGGEVGGDIADSSMRNLLSTYHI